MIGLFFPFCDYRYVIHCLLSTRVLIIVSIMSIYSLYLLNLCFCSELNVLFLCLY